MFSTETGQNGSGENIFDLKEQGIKHSERKRKGK